VVARIARARAIVLLAAMTVSGCDKPYRPVAAAAAPAGSLRLFCTPKGQHLQCRAFARSSDEAVDGTAQEDVTGSVTWSASADIVMIRQGQVTALRPGVATVSATKAWPGRSASASVQVNVDVPDSPPQVVYTIEGVVRDLSNAGVVGVDVAVSDARGHAQDAITREPEGSFSVAALPAGEYRLRASKAAYRPFETMISVPNERPITVALMKEPREQ
jgi:Carboxypeptidase regulatory-like domain